MSIQSGINQLLGMGAIFSQLPAGQNIKENRNLKMRANALQAQQAEIAKHGPLQEGTVAANISSDIDKQLVDVRRRQFEKNPNKQTFTAYEQQRSAGYNEPIMVMQADPDEIAEEIAMQHMQSRGQQQIKQNQNRIQLMDFVRAGSSQSIYTPYERNKIIQDIGSPTKQKEIR